MKDARKRHLTDSLHCNDPCPNCGHHIADPYHVLVECRHPAVVTARSETLALLPARLEQLVLHALLPRHTLQRLDFLARFEEIGRLQKIASDVASLASVTDWQSPDGRFALFHLLAVATWPISSVRREDLYLSRSLAAVFSSCEVKNHHARPLANFWAGWAGSSIIGIFKSWNATSTFPITPVLVFTSDTPVSSPTPSSHTLRKSTRIRTASRRLSHMNSSPFTPESSHIRFEDVTDDSSAD